MSVQQSLGKTATRTMPSDVSSPRAKLVYLYLDVAGTSTVADLQAALDLQKMALFSILDNLVSTGVVEQHGDEYALAA